MVASKPKESRPPTPSNRVRRWIELSDLNWQLVFLLYTVTGLIATGTVFTSELAEGEHRSYCYPLLWEMTGYYAGFAMAPLIVLAFSRIPISKHNWTYVVPLHLAISIAIGVVHTLLMFSSRTVLYELFGWGRYDYGHFGYRLLMEYHKQFLHYWVIYIVLRVLAYYRDGRERERAAAALELKTSELQRQLAQVQLQSLRSQLNPHFLFNTLNMISSVMYENVDRADHMIAALSRMLRMSLEENVGPEVPLRRELEFVEAAGELLRARFGNRLQIEVNCPPSLLNVPVPAMVLHTLVENAIKHHQGEREASIEVKVQVESRNGSVHLHVLDNGPGLADPEAAVGKGVGLANTRQRLRALYGEHFTFELANRSDRGLDVHLAIPSRAEPAAPSA